MHYDDCGRAKRRIIPFVTWEPLPIIAATQWSHGEGNALREKLKS
jgi:hypothetical protein